MQADTEAEMRVCATCGAKVLVEAEPCDLAARQDEVARVSVSWPGKHGKRIHSRIPAICLQRWTN